MTEEAEHNADQRDPARLIPSSVQSPSSVRGACPSLAAPMHTGDGLLVRFRPSDPALSIQQIRQLAEAAACHGNGLLEITSRGSLQIRGLREETLSALEADIAAAGIVPDSGIVIEIPSLSGLDPTELSSAGVMAENLKRAIAGMPLPALAPKLSIVIDGRDRIGLGSLPADIRLTATRREGGDPEWIVAVGGASRMDRRLAILPNERAISATVEILRLLAEIGPRARGRDLSIDRLRPSFPDIEMIEMTDPGRAVASPIGLHDLGSGNLVFGLRLPYGQIHSAELIAFLDRAEEWGVYEVRPALEHCLMLVGMRPEALASAKLAAANFGFSMSTDDPRNHIHTCAGTRGCASAFYDTKAFAARLLTASGLLDGSTSIHLSGCSKGCARPARASLAFVGAPMGYGLVVNGSASDAPVAYIHENDLKSALDDLSRLVLNEKGAGESVDACLTRLGSDYIASALRQG
ncbi:precorrin-3B synthase [Neorhizobium sp. P12A]|nr:precorrin-3B synthase [Neorhizobium sp. P12A]